VSFIKEFQRVQKQTHKINESKGFNDIDVQINSLSKLYDVPLDLVENIKAARMAQKLLLAVGEISETLESLRHGDPPDSHIPKFRGSEAEIADAIIRLMNLAEDGNLRLAEAIIAKSSYNSRRPKFHGGKKF